ncbi:MAG TPA: YdeI/OmpD-associated family protein [Chitinophagales bacterium]|nr:YdeI/OmpD-associated family protein [Chitinophagales bacterium]
MNVLFFNSQKELRKWFQKNYLIEQEAWIGFYNKKSTKQSITWQQLVDEELCFGWIDGIRKKIDGESYCNRITPRRKRSNWSDINIKRIEALIALDLVTEQGKHVFHTRDLTKQKSASFEQEKVELPSNFLKQFKTNKIAWTFFDTQINSYKKAAIWHIISAKQEETQRRRLEALINDSEKGHHLKHLRRNKPEKK